MKLKKAIETFSDFAIACGFGYHDANPDFSDITMLCFKIAFGEVGNKTLSEAFAKAEAAIEGGEDPNDVVPTCLPNLDDYSEFIALLPNVSDEDIRRRLAFISFDFVSKHLNKAEFFRRLHDESFKTENLSHLHSGCYFKLAETELEASGVVPEEAAFLILNASGNAAIDFPEAKITLVGKLFAEPAKAYSAITSLAPQSLLSYDKAVLAIKNIVSSDPKLSASFSADFLKRSDLYSISSKPSISLDVRHSYFLIEFGLEGMEASKSAAFMSSAVIAGFVDKFVSYGFRGTEKNGSQWRAFFDDQEGCRKAEADVSALFSETFRQIAELSVFPKTANEESQSRKEIADFISVWTFKREIGNKLDKTDESHKSSLRSKI